MHHLASLLLLLSDACIEQHSDNYEYTFEFILRVDPCRCCDLMDLCSWLWPWQVGGSRATTSSPGLGNGSPAFRNNLAFTVTVLKSFLNINVLVIR